MQVRAVPQGLELVARGRVGSREARRTVALATCSEVQEAAVLLVAMTLAPAAFEAPPPPSAPAPAQPPAPVISPLAPRARDDKAPSSGIGLGLLIGGTGDFLSLPSPSGGPALGLQLALRRWRIGLDARYFFPRRQAGLGAPARATVGLTAFAFSTGLRWTFGGFALGPQAELEAGFLRGETTGVDGSGVRRTLWLAGLLGLVAEYSVSSRIAFQLAGSGGAPFWRPRFALEGERAFFTTAPAVFRMLFGMYVWLDTKD
jgi:hypothetical protein